MVGLRRRIAVLTVSAAMLALTVPAQASFHQLRINEVQLSAGGDSLKQFVELFDPANEPFPALFGPYKVFAYDANGVQVGSPITLSTAASYANPTPVVLASASAGVASDQPLTISLPVANGQLCYTHGADDSVKVDCITWGTITTQVSPSSVHGPAPVDGQSLQRQCDNSLASAAPTPKATNAIVAVSCGGGGGGGGGTDTVKPHVRVLALALHQKLSRVVAHGIAGKLNVDEPARATLELRRSGKAVGRVAVNFTAAATKRFRVKLKPAAATAVGRLSKVTLTLRISVKDTAGNVTRTSRAVKLKA